MGHGWKRNIKVQQKCSPLRAPRFEGAGGYDGPLIRHQVIPHTLLIVLALAGAGCKAPEQPAVTSIIGAVLIDGAGGPPVSDSLVTIENGRIRAAGARASLEVPPGAGEIDGAGQFMVPAVIDVAQMAARNGVLVVRPGDADAAIERARQEHRPVIADIFSLYDARAMTDRGATVLLHMIRDAEVTDTAFIAQLRDLRMVCVPMLSTVRDAAELDLAKRNTKRLADGGVRMAVGSAGDTDREMALLVEAGLSPAQVLVAATRNGAAALGMLDDMGTIEPGKRADLLLLSANPVEDIGNMKKTRRVMRDGQWVRDGGAR